MIHLSQAKLDIIGLGYLGLPLAVEFGKKFPTIIEHRQGYKIACFEEIAFNQGCLCAQKMQQLGQGMGKNSYGQYLLSLVSKGVGL